MMGAQFTAVSKSTNTPLKGYFYGSTSGVSIANQNGGYSPPISNTNDLYLGAFTVRLSSAPPRLPSRLRP